MSKRVYAFDHAHEVPARSLAGLLGGKGSALAEMTALGIDVPPGFTVGLPVFREWRSSGWPEALDVEIARHVDALGTALGRRFGDPADPLLVSVRSGAEVSMPGMLDTVLDLGLNDETVHGLAAASGDDRFAWDSYQRFLRMFATIVMCVDPSALPERDAAPTETTVAVLADAIRTATGRTVPQDPWRQLREAVEAVFLSWDSERARVYRKREGIDEQAGTAVNVQAMVFGNRGPRSGTGVVFSRDPNTGDPVPYGDYLPGGQGEDVVDGSTRPTAIGELAVIDPAASAALLDVLQRLERHYAHVCDVEFTIEDGRLWILQTRAAKLAPVAAVRAAVAFADDPEVPLDRDGALRLVPEATRRRAADDLGGARGASRPEASTEAAPAVTGLGASGGRASGAAVFSSRAALEADHDVILVRPSTSPEDVVGMSAAVGILTSTGGIASHAAVVARGWGLPAVVGASELQVGDDSASMPGGAVIRPGDWITIDGGTGAVWIGDGPDPDASPSPDQSAAATTSDEDSASVALRRLDEWALSPSTSAG